MVDVEFTQYLFPRGEKRQAFIARPQGVAVKAGALRERGYSLEIENNDGMIWLTCINHKTESSVDRWCRDGRAVPFMVDELVTQAFDKFVGGQ